MMAACNTRQQTDLQIHKQHKQVVEVIKTYGVYVCGRNDNKQRPADEHHLVPCPNGVQV